jgi:tRNA threonylcarbamoyladenosine biosynthesis protein TsaB
MKILALDSATSSCSVAVWVDGVALAFERVDLPRGQAEALLPMVERVQAQAGLTLAALDRLAVTIGPGYFTGLRVGLATARGLALATAKPLLGVTTLAAVAAGVPATERGEGIVIVALDSKRAEPYVQAFDGTGRELMPPAAMLPDAFAATCPAAKRAVLAGNASAQFAAALIANGVTVIQSAADPLPDAARVAAIAATMDLPIRPAAPLYLHPVETTQPVRARPLLASR